MKLNKKNLSTMASLIAAVLSLAVAVVFAVYGATYNEYFDYTVILCEIFGALAFGWYAFVNGKAADLLVLAAVFADSFGMGIFFLNSYPVWADWYGHFTMYGSRGGVAPVIAQLAILLVAVIAGIIACFSRKEA